MSETIIDTEQMPKPGPMTPVAFRWALIGSLIYVIKLYSLLALNDWNFDPKFGGIASMLFDIVFIFAILFLASKEYRDKFCSGYINYGKAFKFSFLTGFYIAVILTLFTMFFYGFQVDFDTMMAEQMDKSIEQMKKAGMSNEKIAQNLALIPEFTKTLWFSIVSVLVFSTIAYTIYSLIVAAIIKRNDPNIIN